MSDTRSYKTFDTNKVNYKKTLSKIAAEKKPVFILKLDTTGLDSNTDQIIKISAMKCHFCDYKLEKDDVFERLVRVNKEVPDFCLKLLNITQKDIEQADYAEEVMKEFVTFLGNEPLNIIGFYTTDFMEQFIGTLGFQSGYMIHIDNMVDMYHMAVSVLEPCKGLPGYKFKDICAYLKIDTTSSIEALYHLFNELMDLIPTGYMQAKVISSKYWSKGYHCRYIFLETDCGSLSINCSTGYYKEKTPGIFDVIDLDYLTKYICEKQKCNNIKEFCNKYK